MSAAAEAGTVATAGMEGSAGAVSTSGSTSAGGKAATSATFPLGISPDKNFLVGANGQPFAIQGDAAWSALVQLSQADSTIYLDSRQAHGFNTILVNMLEARFSAHTPKWRNADGQLPFADPNDFTTTNDAYFAHVDWFLGEAEKRGMLVIIAPAYIGYACGDEGWCSYMRINGVAKLARYGQYLGNRYKTFKNILWLDGGDYTPPTTGSPSDLDLVSAVANGIITAENHVHLHAAHWATEVSGTEGPTVPWLDVDTTYSYTSPQLYQKTRSDQARDVGKRPFFLLESMYENEWSCTKLQQRAEMYQPMLSGSTGYMFGNFPIWAMWSQNEPAYSALYDNGLYPGGWKAALDGPGSKLAAFSFQLLGTMPWQAMAPDVGHQILVSGYGAGSAFALCAADKAGTTAVTYETSSLSLQFDMSKFRGAVTARWFDPTTGTYANAATNPVLNTGMQTFTAPAQNAEGSPDWVLVMQAK